MDEPKFEEYEAPHEFEADVQNVVLINHKLVLEGIDRAEAQEVAKLDLTNENQRGVATWIERQHDEFRKAANNLALVGLVARFHHWLIHLANRLRDDKNRTFDRNVVQELGFLDSMFRDAPKRQPVFAKLVDVRDSIIHADSKESWAYNGHPRQIDPRFVHLGEVNFTETNIKEAFEHMLLVIVWYEDKVEKWERAKYGPPVRSGGQRGGC